jgi:hypothetical protein
MGYTLRLRWLCLRRTDAAKPWVSLSDGAEKPVHEMFHYSTMIQVGNGTSTLFWTDRWLNGRSIEELAPCLISMVGPIIRRKRTMVDALQDNKWVTYIRGGLTMQVLLDFLSIWDRVQEVNLTDSQDRVIWRWLRDGAFSTASTYRVFFSGQHAIPGARLLHKTRAPGRCGFFIWLALHDRVWTSARRKRHNPQDDDRCALCDQQPETIDHLLVGCSFSKEIWFLLLQR